MEYIKQYTKFLILSYTIAIVLLCLSSFIFAYTKINDSLINIFVFVIIVVTNLIGSTLLSRKIKKRGLLMGLLFGIIYFSIIYFLTAILYTGFFVNKAVGLYLLMSSVSGVVGGVIGVNIR